jgi:hypothetical protein
MANLFSAGYGTGSCITCGYLTQLRSDMPGQHEVGASQRATGRLPSHSILWCFRRAADLHKELVDGELEIAAQKAATGSDFPADPRHESARILIEKGRNCPEWYEWVEYFDPKWHYEDWRMKEITRTLANIVKEQTTLSDRGERTNTRFNLLFVGIGLIAILIGLTPLVYPNGVHWAVDHAPGAVHEQRLQTTTPTPQATP